MAVVDRGESADELFAFGGEHFHVVAEVDFILAQHFEGLSQSGAAHFELEIGLVAVQSLFDVAGEGHAVVDPHSFGVVDFHDDAVVGRDDQVGQEIVFADEPVGDELFYGFFTDHVSVGV